MGSNTDLNIGIRREIGTLGMRNFENVGTVLYKANRQPLEFMGTVYDFGDELPFDVDGTSYSAAALQVLDLYWGQGWIVPAA